MCGALPKWEKTGKKVRKVQAGLKRYLYSVTFMGQV
jgi:hypothetical protein